MINICLFPKKIKQILNNIKFVPILLLKKGVKNIYFREKVKFMRHPIIFLVLWG